MSRLLVIVFMAAALALPCCELPQEPLGADATDVAGALDADAAAAPDTGGTPVPCSALTGTWQMSLCNSNAVAIQFASSGCTALILSLALELDGGTAELRQPDRLRLALPGGVLGVLSCEARLTPTSFQGTCVNAVNNCAVAGVRAF